MNSTAGTIQLERLIVTAAFMVWGFGSAAPGIHAQAPPPTPPSVVDPNLGVSEVATMDRVLADSTSDRRLNMLLFALLGGLALALATVGVYGVIAYSVTQRTHEIGVRMAIGAKPADVMRMVLDEGGRLAPAGVALGSAIAFAGARPIRGLLFNVSATDPITFIVVALALLGVALLASYIPARRATRVDPMVALRGE